MESKNIRRDWDKMAFEYTENTKRIYEINQMMIKQELIVDNSYQRNMIWLDCDKVRLIETILLNYVIPSVYWWQSEIDPNTGGAITHIVDGQQRLTSITDFVNDRFKLKSKYLLTEECQEKYGEMSFSDLPQKVKTAIWNYKISVIEIGERASKEDVIQMFTRLNLTEYTLNPQEKRHAQQGLFHESAVKIANHDFWASADIFTANDVRRMLDVQFCASILILYKSGIVDQADMNKTINYHYSNYRKSYPEQEDDLRKIEDAINMYSQLIEFAKNESGKLACSFLKKKVQCYSIFSVLFYMLDKGMKLDQVFKNRLLKFIDLYNNMNNDEVNNENINSDIQKFVDTLRRYKQAVSEGVNKLANRLIRFNILKETLVEGKYDSIIESQGSIDIIKEYFSV